MFAIEYATLFDLINPGLAALDLPIPLGGTSNHFRVETLRRVGAWDAWNVTEDADLGMRLAFAGARVGALASSTAEEAPAEFAAWFRQRVRWQKGWMQTLIVHSRRPLRFARALGRSRALAALALIGGSTLGGLFGPPLFFAALWRAASGQLGAASVWQIFGDVAIYLLALSGLMTMAVPGLTAMRRRRHRGAPEHPRDPAALLRNDLRRDLGGAVRSGDPAAPLGQDRTRREARRGGPGRRRCRSFRGRSAGVRSRYRCGPDRPACRNACRAPWSAPVLEPGFAGASSGASRPLRAAGEIRSRVDIAADANAGIRPGDAEKTFAMGTAAHVRGRDRRGGIAGAHFRRRKACGKRKRRAPYRAVRQQIHSAYPN